MVSGKFDLLNLKTLFVLYYFLQYGLWPIHSHFAGVTSIYPIYPEENDRIWAALYAVLGMLAFYGGYYTGVGRIICRHIPVPSLRYSSKKMFIVILCAIIISVLVHQFFLGFVEDLYSKLRFRDSSAMAGYQPLLFLLTAVPSACLWISFAIRPNASPLWILSLILSVALVMGNTLLMGFRGSLVYSIFGLLIIHCHLRRKLRFRHICVFALGTLLFLGGYFYTVEKINEYKTLGWGEQPLTYEDYVLNNGSASFLDLFMQRFPGLDMVGHIIHRIDHDREMEYFRHFFIEILTTPIPRKLYEDKVTPIGIRFSREFVDIESGLSPTILGELYINLHVAGIVWGMLGLGMFVSAANSLLLTDVNAMKTVLYANSCITVLVMVESLTLGIDSLIISSVLIVLLLSIVSEKGRLSALRATA